MNIFCLDVDPRKAAEMHVSIHAIKQLLESTQLLCTAHRVLDGVPTGKPVKYRMKDSRDIMLYSATHINHPSALWTRQSRDNYLWLCELTQELSAEYTYRYGKFHKCKEIGLIDYLTHNVPSGILDGAFSLPTPAMPDECKIRGDVVGSYRKYYNTHKRDLFNWRGTVGQRQVPDWIENYFGE